jgi:translocation and assembly module TamA
VTRSLAALVASVALLGAVPALAVTDLLPGKEASGLAYRTRIQGVEDKSLMRLLEASSQLRSLGNRRPLTLVALERRVRNDLERLQTVLRSEGYYGARIDYQLAGDERPVAVTLNIDPGERYRLVAFAIRYSGAGADDPDLPQEPEDVGVSLGGPARAEVVVSGLGRLLALLAERGHPLAEVVDRTVVVDHEDSSMSVSLEVAAGRLAFFGPLEVEGAVGVEPGYIEEFVAWQEGERFDRRQLDRTRDRLLETGLFAAVALERPNELDAEGRLPITLRIEERKHRSIGLAASWSTDEGFSLEAEWEHRSLFGRGERLSVQGEAGEIKQEFGLVFRKPRFLRPDQVLLLEGALANEDTDAYSGPLMQYFAGVERRVGARWLVVGGVPLEFSNLDDLEGRREFALFGLRALGERDASNDRLNPSSGSRLALTVTPYHGIGDNQVTFLTNRLSLSRYFALDDDARFVLAGRARFGSTVGESTRSLPANKRFYTGGGASIRGYRFQSVGPLGPGETPLGGRSLFEVSAELRVAITDSIGLAVFADGGNVYDDVLPDLSTNPRWAAGFGGRYFTTFGPIRLDFGFPLNGRDGIDDLMQFYISVGQAF